MVTTLVLAIPTMIVAEDWRGRPLIDDKGAWWLLPGALAAAAFFIGGMVSARGRRTTSGSLAAALTMALPTVAVLLLADGARRALMKPPLPAGVVDLWIEASVVAVAIALVGGLTMALCSDRRDQRTADATEPEEVSAKRVGSAQGG